MPLFIPAKYSLYLSRYRIREDLVYVVMEIELGVIILITLLTEPNLERKCKNIIVDDQTASN